MIDNPAKLKQSFFSQNDSKQNISRSEGSKVYYYNF